MQISYTWLCKQAHCHNLRFVAQSHFSAFFGTMACMILTERTVSSWPALYRHTYKFFTVYVSIATDNRVEAKPKKARLATAVTYPLDHPGHQLLTSFTLLAPPP